MIRSLVVEAKPNASAEVQPKNTAIAPFLQRNLMTENLEIGLRQVIVPQREVLSNLINEQRLSNSNDIRDLFRHLYKRLLGIYDLINTQRDLTGNVLVDIIADQQSRKLGIRLSRPS